METRAMHCTPVSRTPVAAQTTLQVKMDFMATISEWGFGLFGDFAQFGVDLLGRVGEIGTAFIGADGLASVGDSIFTALGTLGTTISEMTDSYVTTIGNFKAQFGGGGTDDGTDIVEETARFMR